jgi:hypothetical protein
MAKTVDGVLVLQNLLNAWRNYCKVSVILILRTRNWIYPTPQPPAFELIAMHETIHGLIFTPISSFLHFAVGLKIYRVAIHFNH